MFAMGCLCCCCDDPPLAGGGTNDILMSETFSGGKSTFIVVGVPADGTIDTVLLDIVVAGLPALAVSLESCT